MLYKPFHIDYRRLKQALFKLPFRISVKRKIRTQTAGEKRNTAVACKSIVRNYIKIGYSVPHITSIAVIRSLSVLRKVKAQRLKAVFFGDLCKALCVFLTAHLSVYVYIQPVGTPAP